jgi:hypothetical protein
MSRTIADEVKCFSTWGVVGMVELDPQGNWLGQSDQDILPLAFAADRANHGHDFEPIPCTRLRTAS